MLVVGELWGHRRDDIVVVHASEALLGERGAVVHPGVKGQGPPPIENPVNSGCVHGCGGRGKRRDTVFYRTRSDAETLGPFRNAISRQRTKSPHEVE